MKRGASWVVIVGLAGCQVMAPGRGGSTGPSGAGAAGESGGGGQLVTPNLVGKSFAEASALVQQAGFRNAIEESSPVECDTAPPGEGLIRCQDPEPGQRVASYAMVHVNVYHRPDHHGRISYDELQSLVGMTVAQARARLAQLGNRTEIRVQTVYRDLAECKFGAVCSVQNLDDIELDVNATVAPQP